MSEERWQIPNTWKWEKAKNIAQIIGGGTPKNSQDTRNYDEEGIPWLTPADLSKYQLSTVSRGKRNLSNVGYANSSTKILPIGSVLYSSRAPIGYCVIAENEITTNQGFKNFIPYGNIDPRYLRYYLLSAKEYAESKASGTTFLELSGKATGELVFPIAPLNEQKRIADKIDALKARSDKIKSALDAIPAFLDQYRQSILHAAFSGDLTKVWREQNLDTSSGISSSVISHDTDKPQGWQVRSLESLVEPERGIPYGVVQTGQPTKNGVPTVRAGDIKGFKIVKRNLKRISPAVSLKYQRTILKGGEVLLSIRGTVGNAAVVGENLINCNISREIALIPVLPKINPYYIAFLLASPDGQSFLRKKTKGVAQQGINLSDIRAFPVLVPPVPEQDEIVKQIRSHFEKLNAFEKTLEICMALRDDLIQSIVAKAFRGQLVPQDPSDEPASALLGRIKIERAEMAKNSRLNKKVVKIRKISEAKKMIIPVIQALKNEKSPLTAQDLLTKAGYPHDATTNQVEPFFLDIRDALQAKKITHNRVGDEDVFELAG